MPRRKKRREYGSGSYEQLPSGRWRGRAFVAGSKREQTLDQEEEIKASDTGGGDVAEVATGTGIRPDCPRIAHGLPSSNSKSLRCQAFLEAATGFEPVMTVLQTVALPLGDAAETRPII